LQRCVAALRTYFNELYDMGQDLTTSDIYRILNSVTGVVDATSVKVVQKLGTGYSTTKFNVKNNTSPDGRFVRAPKNVIFEVKYPTSDIQGTAK